MPRVEEQMTSDDEEIQRECSRMAVNPDGTVMKFDGEYLDEIKTQISTDPLRLHGWAQMGKKFPNANGRKWPRIFANPDGLN